MDAWRLHGWSVSDDTLTFVPGTLDHRGEDAIPSHWRSCRTEVDHVNVRIHHRLAELAALR